MKKSFFIAVFILLLATVWVLSGVLGNKDNNAEVNEVVSSNSEPEQPQAKKEIEVRVADLEAQLMKDDVIVTGRTQASRKVNLSAEISGQIVSILVEKGGIVSKGAIIAKLGTQDRGARVSEADQLVKQRQIQYNASKDLSEKGFNSKVRLAEARAQLESARAQLKQARVNLSNINIKAPFGGVINDQMVEIGDYVSPGTNIVSLVDLNPIEISGFLTEKQLMGVSTGVESGIEFLDGQKVQGTINYIASVADEQTRTFQMEVSVANPELKIKEGLTAKIKIPLAQVEAYKISPSILSLSDKGSIGVKIVDENNVVKFMPARLLKDTPEYLWIGGLPEKIRLITVGQEFVVEGQTVNPVVEGTR